MKKARPKDHLERLRWLKANPIAWEGLPSLRDDVDNQAQRDALRELTLRMTELGYFSKNTPMVTRVWGLRGLIGEARGQAPYMAT